jgi:uncharacterized protein (DUF849 family)
MNADAVIVTCSISGAAANREQCPAIPYSPAEYAAEARRAVDAGASMIHIHARKPDGTPSFEVEDFRAITEAILAEVDDGRSSPQACPWAGTSASASRTTSISPMARWPAPTAS